MAAGEGDLDGQCEGAAPQATPPARGGGIFRLPKVRRRHLHDLYECGPLSTIHDKARDRRARRTESQESLTEQIPRLGAVTSLCLKGEGFRNAITLQEHTRARDPQAITTLNVSLK